MNQNGSGIFRKCKRLLKRLLLPHQGLPKPISGMTPDNLYAYLDALYQKRFLNGPVLEVGIFKGGTSAIAATFLARQGLVKPYVCIDTFDGFIEDHVHEDSNIGLNERNFQAFTNNSLEDVRESFKAWGVSSIELIKGDICSLDQDQIPSEISVCLMDVDLKIPVYEGLKRVYPRMQSGGCILVDDCTDGTSWVGAIEGYRNFIKEFGLTEKYFMGFGVVEIRPEYLPLNWAFSTFPVKETHYFFRESNPIPLINSKRVA